VRILAPCFILAPIYSCCRKMQLLPPLSGGRCLSIEGRSPVDHIDTFFGYCRPPQSLVTTLIHVDQLSRVHECSSSLDLLLHGSLLSALGTSQTSSNIKNQHPKPQRRTENPLGKQATIHTTMGDIVVKLFHQVGATFTRRRWERVWSGLGRVSLNVLGSSKRWPKRLRFCPF